MFFCQYCKKQNKVQGVNTFLAVKFVTPECK